MLSTRPPMTDSLGSRGRSRQPGMTVGFQLRTRPGWLDGLMDPVVRVSGGLVRGSSRDGVNSFLGIPYAGPAVGGDRYRAPRRGGPGGGERGAADRKSGVWGKRANLRGRRSIKKTKEE